MIRIGLPSTLLLAICSKIGAVRFNISDLFSNRANSDPDYFQVAFLGSFYTATEHFLIRITFIRINVNGALDWDASRP